jgi:ornithine decarboxylase
MAKFQCVNELVKALQPIDPVYCFRKQSLKLASNWFNHNFPGDVLYAVKCNPTETVVKTLIKNGINSFDTASIDEIKLIKKISPSSKIYFMHTIKKERSIYEAYFLYNVKAYAFDSKEELEKILKITKNAKDLELFLRVQTSNEHAEIDLSKKFGANINEAVSLSKIAKSKSKKFGFSFHVGSQCMHPIAYSKAIKDLGNIIKKSNIIPDIINVGGGFPTTYPDLYPQPIKNYFLEIARAIKKLNLSKQPKLICEPGRALVAESGSTIVRVELKKKQNLYINDGTYGSLFDAGTPKFIFPTKAIQINVASSKRLIPYSFYGPTCDGLDYMKGPFMLPSNIKTGDYIEIGQLGAYGMSFRTNFNGFYSNQIHEVQDKPLMSIYEADENYNVKTLYA